ncbi:helix-turn-helix domain-containing protein, partial [Paenibacillus alvei]
MATRVSYPAEVKLKAIEMRLAGIPVKEVMNELNIKNETQLKVWMKWYREGELYRLEQPVGKQYSYGKGPEYLSELEKVKAENRFLKQQREGLQCRVKVKKRKPTGQPAHVAEHLLKRQFQAIAPMQKLVTDITYLPYGGKTLYLSSILRRDRGLQ